MSENTLIAIAISCAFFLGFVGGMLAQYLFNFSEFFKKYPDQGERETNLPSKLDRG